MSDRQYMEEYRWMSEHGNSIFQPLTQVKNATLKYLPGFVEFRILNKNKDILDTYELPEGKERKAFQPINLTAERYDYTEVHYPKQLIAGCRYPVSLAMAKTLEEVTKEYVVHEIDNTYEKVFTDNEQVLGTTQFDSIKKQLDEFVITAEIKHGGDGMGEIKVWKEKSEKPFSLFHLPCLMLY